MLAVDCETTGTDVESDRILTCAAVSVGGGEQTVARTWLINPGVPIPQAASDVHGITSERVKAEGVAPAVALPEIVAAISEAIDLGRVIVVMCASFDLTLIDREACRHGCESPDWSRVRVVDVSVLDRWLDPFRRGRRNLEALCQHYGATLEGAHDATADALGAARVAWRIAERGAVALKARNVEQEREESARRRDWERMRWDVAALHEHQQWAAAEQAERLERYFRSGDPSRGVAARPDVVVSRDWPLIPARGRDDMPLAGEGACRVAGAGQ